MLILRFARATFSRYAVSSFGVHFSVDSLHEPSGGRLPVLPQITFSTDDYFDSMEWMTLSSSFTAQGGERFLYIGSFQEDFEMDCSYDPFLGGVDIGYYNIDQVELILDGVGIAATSYDNGSAFIIDDVLHLEHSGSAVITIVDSSGRKVLGPSRSNTETLSLPQNLTPGLYFVIIEHRERQILRWLRK